SLDRLQIDRRKEPPPVCQLSFGRYGPQRLTSRFRNKGGRIVHFEEIAHRGHDTGGDVEKGAVLNLDQCRSGDIFAPDPTHIVSIRIRHTTPPRYNFRITIRLQDSGPAGFGRSVRSCARHLVRSLRRPGPRDDDRYPNQAEDHKDAESDRTVDEVQEISLRLYQRSDQVLFQDRSDDDAEHAGCNGYAVLLHQITDDAEDEHDRDTIDRVVGGEGADDAEDQDQRHENLFGDAKDILGKLEQRQSKREHYQVSENEDEEDRINRLRIEDEQGWSRVQALDVEHADHDRSQSVTGNAEDERRHPGGGKRSLIGRSGFSNA